MRLVTYQSTISNPTLGFLIAGHVVNLEAAFQTANIGGPFPGDMVSLLGSPDGMDQVRWAHTHALADGGSLERLPVESVSLLPPVLRPGKILCLGRNYAAHAKEGGAEVLEFPILFFKPSTALLGHGGEIVVPPVTAKPDFEAELAVVIGKKCKDAAESEALDYVAGYTCANDVSARDLQRRTHQWDQGKMPDTFCPLGPTLVTAAEIPDPSGLRIRSILNGNVMQDSNTSLMIFNVPFTISYISRIATLEPGDVILTGTPDGVGSARTPPVFLGNGDTITIEIEKVGVLTNRVRRATPQQV